MKRSGLTDRQKYAAALWRQGESGRQSHRLRLLATGTPNRRRITLALDYHGFDGPEVDAALGVIEPMVDWWEEGRVVPSGEEIERLAALTQFPVEFFYDASVEMGPAWMCGDEGCRLTEERDA